MSFPFSFLPLFSAIVSRVSAYAVLLIAAHLLVPDEFGMFAALITVGAIVNALVSGGGDMWLNRFVQKVAAHHGRAPVIWPVYLAICVSLAILTAIVTGFTALTIDAFAPHGAVVLTAMLAFSIAGLAEASLAVVRATGRVTLFFALRDYFAPLGFLALAAALRPDSAQELFTIYGAVWSTALAGVLALMVVRRKSLLPGTRIRTRQWKIALRHSLGLMMSNLGSRLSVYTDVLVLTLLISLGQLGEYRVVAQFAVGFMVVQHFLFLGLPWQLRQTGTEEQRESAYAWVGARQRTLMILSVIALLLLLPGAEFLLSIFGERFVDAALILQLLLLARFVELLWGPQHEILISNGRIRSDAEANVAAIAAWFPAFAAALQALPPELAAVAAVAVGSFVGQGYRYRCLRREGLRCPRILGTSLYRERPIDSPRDTDRPTLVVVVPSLQLGGTERHLCQILPRLAGRGWAPKVYTINAKGALAADLQAQGIEVREPPLARFLSGGGSLARSVLRAISAVVFTAMIWRSPPGIVHFFLPEAYLLGGLCALTRRKHRLVMSRRSLNDYQARYPYLAFVERWLHRRMTTILGNSRAIIEQLIGEEAVPPHKVHLIYNGIDASLFERRRSRQAARAALAIDARTLTLIIVANLIPYKGHADLLEALQRISPSLPEDWLLLCAGRMTPANATLVARAAQGGLAGHVRFLGERHDVPDLLAAADIGLLCSHQEGFPNSLLEGMAAALPMIVTEVGGNVEAVGETAIIVPPHAPDRLGQAILELAADPARRRDLADAALRRVRQRFTLDRCVAAYDRFYTRMADGLTSTKTLEASMASPRVIAPME